MIYLELLFGFLKVGLFAFGGAYGAIPLIREVVLNFGWIDEEKLSYMIAVGESTPGPIMINLATYIGAEKGGVPGALIATAAVALPAFVVVLVFTLLLKNLLKKGAAQATLGGLKACVIGIILATGAYMIFTNCVGGLPAFSPDVPAMFLTVGLLALHFGAQKLLKNGLSPILLILIAGAAGVLIYGW